jgi:hypothetical protein
MARNPIFRNQLLSPQLMLALEWLRPGPWPRQIETLIRCGRADAAAALAQQLIADADRP